MRPKNDSRKGQVVLIFATFVGLMLGLSAIAFDLAYAMAVRTRVVTASDAAAMAAIRAAAQGAAAMEAAATRAFEANLPEGKLFVESPILSSPDVTTEAGAVKVKYTGTADISLFFARWVGVHSLTINVETAAARRDRNIILLLDYSGSVAPVFDDIKDGAKLFVNSFSDTFDQVGLALFSTSGKIEYAAQQPFKSDLNPMIDGLGSEVWTNHTAGLYYAYRALLELNDPLKDKKLNEIVLFTDGEANWFPAQFNVDVGPGDCTVSPISGVMGPGDDYYEDRVLSDEAPAGSAPPPVAPDCPAWDEGENKLQSIQATWIPPVSGIVGPILPGGVPLAGFRNPTPSINTSNPSDSTLRDVAKNTADNLARMIRQDTTLKTRIHTIGYEGNDPLEQDVLERLANCEGCLGVDPADDADPDQAKGRFVLASNHDELIQAFLDVAGYIGRIVE